MFGISIDLGDVINEFNILSEELENLTPNILGRIVDEYTFKWEDNINDALNSTRNEYKKAMYVEFTDNKNAVIGLTPRESQMALMLEEGCSSFDIKEGMEKSGKKKIKKDGGWYMTIPFKHATSEALGESQAFSSVMPKQIEKIAKTNPTLGGQSSPVKFDQLPAQYQKLLSNKTTGVEHKAPIYQGLIRINQSSSNKENRGGYMTFRRISDKSEEGSWQHPGFAPLHLMEKTLAEVDGRISEIVDDEVQKFLNRNR
jgi:hypothetical protein